jgi:peptidyl-prolyl cis-trans isomerase SurA
LASIRKRKGRDMKKRVLVAGIAVFIAGSASGAKIVLDRIIARVNNEIVTQRQYDRQKAELRAELSQRYSGAELEVQVREQSKNLLRDLIDQDLLVEKAKDLDVKVDTDVIKRLDEIRQQQNLGTLEDLQKKVEEQGGDWADFNDGIKRQLQMQQVIGAEVGRHVLVSREDARKYYDAHKQEFSSPAGLRLAEILISADKHKGGEAEQRAKAALAEVKSGARFSDVAKKYSDDRSANQGGDIGFLAAGTLSSELEKALKKLDTGEVSDIIQTKYGPMIIKVLERRQAGIPPFEDVADRVIGMLTDQKMQPALRKYLQTLRKESFIFLAPGYVDTGAERPSEAVLASSAADNTGEQ